MRICKVVAALLIRVGERATEALARKMQRLTGREVIER
jgi:hypothetical protein